MWYPVDETGECLRVGPFRDAPYEEISCLYPMLGKTYTPIDFAGGVSDAHLELYSGMLAHPWIPVVACTIYFAAIRFGQAYFATRPAWNCRNMMAVWNLGLAVFSFWGFMRTAPQLAHNLYYYGFTDTISEDPLSMLGMGSNVHWILCFILSKFGELFDTFFIVVHKKPLMFLHWYHHITVLLFCWYSFICEQPMGIVFCVANYGVHSVMYFYYFLMAAKMRPKWFNPQIITVVQILQMVVGVTVCSHGLRLAGKPGSFVEKKVIVAGFGMYASYLALFMQFFIQRYVVAPSQKAKTL